MHQDFAALIKAEPGRLRILEIRRAYMGYLKLHLTLHVSDFPKRQYRSLELECTNAVDYVIKPPHPATIEGGPLIELHEDHELLREPGSQYVPGGDGEVFNPPLRLKLLMLDQSYVLAEKFELAVPNKPAVK
jgi:hypothetical protein